jgi:hypothetical protein
MGTSHVSTLDRVSLPVFTFVPENVNAITGAARQLWLSFGETISHERKITAQ